MQAEFATCCLLSYNRPQFVREAILTAIAHADYPVEMIVHDDGSDPDTVQVLMELRDQGNISTLILNPEGHNQGQGIALNRMFGMAKGDPIIKMDHDLIFKQGWLRQIVNVLERNEELPVEPFIGSMGLFKYDHEPVDHRKMLIEKHQDWEQHRDYVGSAMVISRRSWEKFGPFEERSEAFAEDYTFKMKVNEDPNWANALPPQDLVVNQGFGVGPSTVVVQKPDGSLTSRSIKGGPYVIDPNE